MKISQKSYEDFLNTFGVLEFFDKKNKQKELKKIEKDRCKSIFRDINFILNFVKFNFKNTWLDKQQQEENLKSIVPHRFEKKKDTYLFKKLRELRLKEI